MSRFMSRREMSRVRAASALAARVGGAGLTAGTSWPSDPVALGILAGTSLVCLLALTTGLSVLAWNVISARGHESPAVTMDTDSSDVYVYVYENTKDLYWTILGGGSFIFLLNFGVHRSFFVGPLIPLFWTSGGVSSGFQSQSGQPYSHLVEACCLRFTSGANTCRPLGDQHGSQTEEIRSYLYHFVY